MAGMALCQRCGGELPAAARFCPACGRPVEPEVGPPAPLRVAPIWAGLRLPASATADWALVGLGAAVLLGVLFAAAAVLGLVAAVAVAGSFKAAPCGAAVGSHLAFAAFGARAAAACGGEHGAALTLGFLPLPWVLAGALSTEAALRFAWRRLPDDQTRRVAYAGKLAVGCGVALGLIAGVVAQGDPSRRGSGFASSLNGGEVWFYSTVLIWLWAWIGLRRRGVRLLSAPPGQARRLGWLAREGAMVFAALASGLALVGLVISLVVTDGLHERIGVLFGFPVVGFSFGAALLDAAMGAGLGGVTGHTSLAHFGMPAGPEAGAAPVWVFAAVLLAPAAVAVVVWRRLERERPAQEQDALAVGAVTAVGFAAAAWLAALVGRIVVLAATSRVSGFIDVAPRTFDGRETIGTLVALRPNPAAVLGLGLLWSLAGGLGAGFLWASRHHARWQISGAGGPAAAPSAAPPPPTAGPSAWLLPESPTSAASSGGEGGSSQELGAAEDPPEEKP
jgi:hypothetical protein